MTVGKKLVLAFGTIMAVVLALAAASFWSLTRISDALDLEITKTSKKVELGSRVSTLVYQMRAAQRGVVMYSLLKQPAQVESAKALFQAGIDNLRKTATELRLLVYKPAAVAALNRIEAELVTWPPRYQNVVDLCAKQQFDAELSRLLIETGAANTRMNQAAEALVDVQRKTQAEEASAAQAIEFASRWIAVFLTALSVVVGAVVLFIIRRINTDLREIAMEMAEGANQVAAAASQLSSSSQALAAGASEQAASLEETSASAEEISSMTRRNAEASKSAALNMQEASQRIEDANRNLEQMVVSMGGINACSEKISGIIKVIDEIAFQTNILALNAAVEAARAGDAGMGFAIVADEVRNLAQRSASAARDTSTLIEESIAKTQDGKSKLEQVAKAVHSITSSATKVGTLVDDVKYGSDEQSRGIEQVAKAIAQMDSVTRTVASSAEESAAASEQLNAQADSLQTIVTRLNAMVGSAAGTAAADKTYSD